MEFDELINGGWSRHESETEAVALELEENAKIVEDAGQAASFCALASHAVGEHLGDWERAAGLIEKALEGIANEPALTSSVILLGVAREFGEDLSGAEAAFERARALAGDEALVKVRTHLARASAYMGVGTSADLIREHADALEVVATMSDTASRPPGLRTR